MGVSGKEPSLFSGWRAENHLLGSGGLDTLAEKWIWELINASVAFYLAQTLVVS